MLVLLTYLTSQVPLGFLAEVVGGVFMHARCAGFTRELALMLRKWAEHTRCPEEKAVSASGVGTLPLPGLSA